MIQYIKITGKGKISLLLPSHLKYFFKNMLELFMNDVAKSRSVDLITVQSHICVALMDEVYRKYHTQLCFINGEVKILLTRAQAYALWTLCQEYDQYVYNEAGMSGILMQLHQKLS